MANYRVEARLEKGTPIVEVVYVNGTYSDAEHVMFQLMRKGLRYVDIKNNK